jgi:hypothetical protein
MAAIREKYISKLQTTLKESRPLAATTPGNRAAALLFEFHASPAARPRSAIWMDFSSAAQFDRLLIEHQAASLESRNALGQFAPKISRSAEFLH